MNTNKHQSVGNFEIYEPFSVSLYKHLFNIFGFPKKYKLCNAKNGRLGSMRCWIRTRDLLISAPAVDPRLTVWPSRLARLGYLKRDDYGQSYKGYTRVNSIVLCTKISLYFRL